MIGYKMFDSDWKCRDFQYKNPNEFPNEIYETNDKISVCAKGFHFCEKLVDCFKYYAAVSWNHIAKVEAIGEVITEGNKSVTNKLKVIREVKFDIGINDSCGIDKSNGINHSNGINWSDGINDSNGINASCGIDRSNGINYSNGINGSCSINDSNGVNRSDGVNGSNGINDSNGINTSCGINYSNGINDSCGIDKSNGINESCGINWSNGINDSDGINRSDGINCSDGINYSYGIFNSFGVSNALFLADKPQTWSIFGRDVNENRFYEVRLELFSRLGDWKPTFNNLKSLYIQHGSEWKNTPIPNAEELSIKEAWEGMPKAAIEYIRSLPEFNATMFEKITGIKEA